MPPRAFPRRAIALFRVWGRGFFVYAMLVVCLLLFLYWIFMVYLDPEHLDYSS